MLAELDDDQVIFAANLAARRLIVTAFSATGATFGDVEGELSSIVQSLNELDPSLFDAIDINAVATILRDITSQIGAQAPDLRESLDRAVAVTRDNAQSVGWGAESAALVVSIGFAISLIIIVAQVEFGGQLGQWKIQKKAGVPTEVVEIVKAVSEAAANAINEKKPAKQPRKK